MCLFNSPAPPQPMKSYAPPATRTLQAQNPLPEKKEVPDVGEVGLDLTEGAQTKSNPAAGKKKGASALKIALNQPAAGANQGGISNV